MPEGCVFLRPSGARYHGHVGWGFELPDGGYLVGGIELPNAPFRLWMSPATMGFWALRVADPFHTMSGPPHWDAWHSRYDLVKRLPVAKPDYRAALRRVHQIRRRPWLLLGRNCMDAAASILTAYGVQGLPTPSLDWGPIRFYNDTPAASYALMQPVGDVDATLYSEPGLGGGRFAVLTAGGESQFASRWASPVRSLVVRSGYLAIYPEPGFRGTPTAAGPGTVLNLADGPGWPAGSLLAAAEPFDAAQTPHSIVPLGAPSGPQTATSPNMPHSLRGRGTVPHIDGALPPSISSISDSD